MNKGFFKVRRNAILITVFIILLATLFGLNRSLGGKIMEVSDMFNDGVTSGDIRLKAFEAS
jgi:hypothetical protein